MDGVVPEGLAVGALAAGDALLGSHKAGEGADASILQQGS